MKTKQKNMRIDLDVCEWIDQQAAKDDRDQGYFLSKLIREKHMKTKAKKKAVAVVDDSLVMYKLPTIDGWHLVTQNNIDDWSKLYAAVDINQEIKNMIGWLDANPAKRKTPAGMPKFINSWLSKSQEKGGSSGMAKENFVDKHTDRSWADGL